MTQLKTKTISSELQNRALRAFLYKFNTTIMQAKKSAQSAQIESQEKDIARAGLRYRNFERYRIQKVSKEMLKTFSDLRALSRSCSTCCFAGFPVYSIKHSR